MHVATAPHRANGVVRGHPERSEIRERHSILNGGSRWPDQLAFLCRAFDLPFLGARAAAFSGIRRSPPPRPDFTLCAQRVHEIDDVGPGRLFGRSIFSPFCFFFSKSLSASS